MKLILCLGRKSARLSLLVVRKLRSSKLQSTSSMPDTYASRIDFNGAEAKKDTFPDPELAETFQQFLEFSVCSRDALTRCAFLRN